METKPSLRVLLIVTGFLDVCAVKSFAGAGVDAHRGDDVVRPAS